MAIITALAVTGGITTAAILLAAVFAVLGVLALITLTELGIIVWFGVLLDTLLVRTVLVPTLVVLGRQFWWPGAIPPRHENPPGRRRTGSSCALTTAAGLPCHESCRRTPVGRT